MAQQLNLFSDAPLSVESLFLNLGVGVVLSLILRWHFKRFGSTLSNREEFAQVFPFILLTTVLIISVVKSSLALSLGLVGALSIVRFRTPIKEPEELAYLFVAIAMGLGLGAAQTLPTILAGLGILTVVGLLNRTRLESGKKNLYLSIDQQAEASEDLDDNFLNRINDIISKHVALQDLRRFDVRNKAFEATYFVEIATVDNLTALTEDLRRISPNIGITFLDQNRLPSV